MNTTAKPTETALPPLLVSEPEAARLLGVCPKTVYTLRRAGKLRAVKIGAAVRYSTSELHRFVAGLRPEDNA